MKGSGALTKPPGALNQPAAGHAKKNGNTGKLISAHYLEIEYLLARVEGSSTHYQTLGVDRAATNEEIVVAYHETIAVLHPSYHKVRAAVPDEMLSNIDKVFGKVSQAFFILTDRHKRIEYDQSLKRRKVVPLPLDAPRQKKPRHSGGLKKARSASGSLNNRATAQETQAPPASTRPAVTNRRRCERFKLSVPALVSGHDRDGSRWQEVIKTIDVSRMGVALKLGRHVRVGIVLHVTLPLPMKLRSHGFTEQGYNMYAIVRRVEPDADGSRVVGLEFIGSHPPAGYLHKPHALFRTQKWSGPDRRREQRFELAESVLIEYLDESQNVLAREVAITENVSASGARISVKSAPAGFEMVKVTGANRSFESIAMVRNHYATEDGNDHLCVQFKDGKWPIED
ncbi:MAG TPA: PilZ domain-containing protein [Blastocatellia bacterium]|nr:PilZ domain-containing protein [Blastocatellia bacterium]